MDNELVEKFIEVTGANEVVAAQYLSLADGNLENAISLMFEGGGVPADTDPVPAVSDEPEVRAPILPVRELLVPSQPICSFPRASNSIFDGFRDFAAETQRQEEEMARRVSGTRKISSRKTKRLEDLFRPPYELMFRGSFAEAREHAKMINRWLLVNVQNPAEFSCQILNRDFWPDTRIRDIVRDHFVLWQVLSNTSDGQRYIDFYNVADYPHLAVLDPRTGECIRTYNQITVDDLVAGLSDMLSMNSSPDSTPQLSSSIPKDCSPCTATSASKRRNADADSHNDAISSCSKRSKATRDADEDGKVAVSSNGLDDSGAGPSVISSVRMVRPRPPIGGVIVSKRSKAEEAPSTNNHEILHSLLEKKPELPNEPEPVENNSTDERVLRLCLRLPNGGKEAITMSAGDTIKTFLNRMESLGYPPTDYTYLVSFPRANIGALSYQTRLSNTVLFPSNTVFITRI